MILKNLSLSLLPQKEVDPTLWYAPDSKWHDHVAMQVYEMSTQTEPPVTSKQRWEHLETQYQIIFQWLCVKHPWKHPFIHMRG